MQITVQTLAVIVGSVGGGGYVATAVVNTMPPKDADWNWRTVYGWFFDCAHLLINSRRPTQDPPNFNSSISPVSIKFPQ